MKFRYHSFDYDGCLNNEAFDSSLSKRKKGNDQGLGLGKLPPKLVDEALIEANQELLKTIKPAPDVHDVVMVGSNRQNFLIDFANGLERNGSVLPRLQAISKYLKASFDGFLLADLVSGKKFGSEVVHISKNKLLNSNGSYEHANEFELSNKPENTFVVDEESKVGLLFAQMQKAAMDHPNDEIEFNFYEDREDILNGVKGFFAQHPELVPKNIVLNIHGYSGPKPSGKEAEQRREGIVKYGPPEQIAVVKGQGRVPRHADDWVPFYKDITGLLIAEGMQRDMATRPQDIMRPIHLAKDFNVQKLLDQYIKEQVPFGKIPILAQDVILNAQADQLIRGQQVEDNNDHINQFFKLPPDVQEAVQIRLYEMKHELSEPILDKILNARVDQLIRGQQVADNNDHINQFFKLPPDVQEAVQIRLYEMKHELSKPILERIHQEERFQYLLEKLDKLNQGQGSVSTKQQEGIIDELKKWPDRLPFIMNRYAHSNMAVDALLNQVVKHFASLYVARYDEIKDKSANKKELDDLVKDYFKLPDWVRNEVVVQIQSPTYKKFHDEIQNRGLAMAFINNLEKWTENPNLLQVDPHRSRYAQMVLHVAQSPTIKSMLEEHYQDKFLGKAKDFFEAVTIKIDELKFRQSNPVNPVRQAKLVIGARREEEQQQQDTNTNNYASKTGH